MRTSDNRSYPSGATERRTPEISSPESRWKVTTFRPYAEGADLAYVLALRGVADPLDDEFTECANTVFGPLQACLQDPRL